MEQVGQRHDAGPQAAHGAADDGLAVGHSGATRYICSLYWALSVLTNLKGLPAHESRQCLYHDPLVPTPLRERIYTMTTFIIGATFYSIIYGNIGQFVANLYQADARFKKRMSEMCALPCAALLRDSLPTRAAMSCQPERERERMRER